MEFSTLNGYKVKDKKAIRYYDTVNDMKNDTTLKNGMHVKTKGYYEANDGGNGEYIIVNNNELVEDGGSIHELTNGLRAKLIINDIINVKQFGAKGDNIHDDTSYFNFALNNYNKIYLGSGTYLINSTINCNKSNVSIEGNDATLNINTSGHGLIFKNVNNIEIKNIKFESQSHYNNPSSSNQNNHMIKIYNCNNIRFIENTLNYGCMGLTIGKADNIEIKNNIISNFKGWGLYLGCDENFTTYTTLIKNCNIINNQASNCEYDGLKLTGYLENITIENNKSFNNTSDGIDYAGHSAKNVQILNNECFNNSLNGIDFKLLDRTIFPINSEFEYTKVFNDIYIHDNIINNNVSFGINIQLYYNDVHAQNVIIKNNIINLRDTATSQIGTGIRVSPFISDIDDALIIDNNIISDNIGTTNYGIRLTNTNKILVINNIIKKYLSAGIQIDYNSEIYSLYEIASSNNKIINNNIETLSSYANPIFIADTNVSNLLIKSNKLNSNSNSYLISPNLYNEASNIAIDNEYTGELFSSQPAGRTTKNVIYKSSDPITTGCVGWIGKQNSSEAQYAEYIPITIS